LHSVRYSEHLFTIFTVVSLISNVGKGEAPSLLGYISNNPSYGTTKAPLGTLLLYYIYLPIYISSSKTHYLKVYYPNFPKDGEPIIIPPLTIWGKPSFLILLIWPHLIRASPMGGHLPILFSNFFLTPFSFLKEGEVPGGIFNKIGGLKRFKSPNLWKAPNTRGPLFFFRELFIF